MARSRANASYTITAADRTRAGIASAKSSLNSLDAVVARLGIGFSVMGAAAAAAPLGIVSSNAPVIDSYGKLSEKLGIAVGSIQGYVDAAEKAGISTNTLATSFQRGLRRVSEAANGIGEARGALDELGLSAVELARLAPEERIDAILEAMQELADEGDRVRLAAKIFDSEGVDLVRLMASNAEAATDRFEELGIALTEVDVAGVETMNDELQTLQSNTRASAQLFTSEMAPAVTGLIRTILGAGDSMNSFREVSQASADIFIDFIGAIGNGVEGLDNVFDGVKIGLQELNVLASRAGALFGSEESEQQLEAQLAVLQRLKDELAGQTGDETFWTRLERETTNAREEAERAAAEIDALRERYAEGIDVGLGTGQSNFDNGPKTGTTSEGETGTDSKVDSAFAQLVQQLESDTQKIESEYQRRIEIVEAFKQQYPERIQEAIDAELAAMEARSDAIAALEAQQEQEAEQQRSSTLRPLEYNFENVKAQFQSETDFIVEEIERRQELLAALGDLDVERKLEADALIVALERDKQEQLAAIERSGASSRLQQQASYAAQALGIASSLVTSLAGQGERSKRISARVAQAEALVAGISAAERARNQASLYGGVAGGFIAAALSWGGTLANVAGIEAALQGGTPSGASGASGSTSVPSGAEFDNNAALESTLAETGGTNVTMYNIVTDDKLINEERLEATARKAIAKGTQSRTLVYSERRSAYFENEETA